MHPLLVFSFSWGQESLTRRGEDEIEFVCVISEDKRRRRRVVRHSLLRLNSHRSRVPPEAQRGTREVKNA